MDIPFRDKGYFIRALVDERDRDSRGAAKERDQTGQQVPAVRSEKLRVFRANSGIDLSPAGDWLIPVAGPLPTADKLMWVREADLPITDFNPDGTDYYTPERESRSRLREWLKASPGVIEVYSVDQINSIVNDALAALPRNLLAAATRQLMDEVASEHAARAVEQSKETLLRALEDKIAEGLRRISEHADAEIARIQAAVEET